MDTGAEPSRSFIPIVVTIVGLTIGAGILIARMGRTAVMKDWANRRCEVPIMFAGSFYKPDSDPRTAGQFSADNFSYCIKEMQKTAMGTAFAAPLKIFEKQVAAAKTVAESQNADKLGIANLLNGIVGQILGDFYKRFRIFGDQLSRIMQRFRMSYDRVAGAVNAIALAGLSMMQAIFNAYNTIILVVIIILSIIAGVFILLFFALFPFLPLLLTTVAVLAGVGFSVGGLATVFCFAPETQVEMADGSRRAMADLQLGDIVHGGGHIQGMYVMDGRAADMYSLDGVIVSGDHLVWNEVAGHYCAVAEHPAARRHAAGPALVYCPLISNRSLRAGGNWFRDWEEIEDASEGRWHSLIAGMLDSYAGLPASFSTGFTTAVNVFSEKFKGWIPIDCVNIGDRVLMKTDNDGWLEYSSVLGKTVVEGEYDDDAQMGPASWLHSAEGWKHPAVNYLKEGLLYNLITKSGHFMVKTPAGQICVRDALEVGISRIEETYAFTASELRKTESRPPNR
jgi:hypothetical protein